MRNGRKFLALLLLMTSWCSLVSAQSNTVIEFDDKKPSKENSKENDLVIVEFNEKTNSLVSKPGTVTDVVNFDLSNVDFDDEYSLSEDGESIPASKLFTQLMAEKAEREKKPEIQDNLDANNVIKATVLDANGQPVSQAGVNKYKKITTVTTTSYYNNETGNVSVSANYRASADAMRLVKLASLGDGIPLQPAWAQHMIDAGRTFNIDPVLLLEVCRQESRFKNTARSGANAHGLMQFIPATAQRFGINPYDPQQAIYAGAKYLRTLLNMFGGEVRSALAGYNAGEGAVIAFSTGRTLYSKNKVINPGRRITQFGIPPYEETQNYVATIFGKYLMSLRRLNGSL